MGPGEPWVRYGDDCDDADPDRYPNNPELCDGVVDNDCDGLDDIEVDGDGDGYTVCDDDCDDADPNLDPADADADGWASCDGDCDDGDPQVSPGETEVCNDGIDNDCNPASDDACDCPWQVDGSAVGSLELGTIDDPFTSIQNGIDAIGAACDWVRVLPGTYFENLQIIALTGTLTSADGVEATSIDGQGGQAVYVEDSALAFEGFTVEGGLAAKGGGIHVNGGSMAIADCVVRDNTCQPNGEGGGLYAVDASLTVTGCVFQDNVCGDGTSSGNDGGGLALDHCDAELTGNRIEDNVAGDGGGLYILEGPVTLLHNVIWGNAADDTDGSDELAGGGGVLVRGDGIVLINNLVGANTAAESGGGVLMQQTTYDSALINNAVVENAADQTAAAVAFHDTQQATLYNNIVAYNAGIALANTSGWDYFEIQYNALYDNAGGDYGGTLWDRTGVSGNIAADPLFVTFTPNGDDSDDDYHLQPTSPCIDTGHYADEFDDPDGSRNDMGMYGGPYGSWP